MTKRILSLLSLLFFGTLAFAGDLASFVDIGFSADGRTYIFGQYGKTDRDYKAYAEIYTIDVARNEYVPGHAFNIPPTAATAKKTGLAVFEELKQKNATALNFFQVAPVPLSHTLYLRENEKKSPLEALEFEDFERTTSAVPLHYEVRLVPSYEGYGKNVRSTLDVVVEAKDQDGNLVMRKHVGTPSVKRKGVSGYAVSKVFADESGKSLVFVIEKTLIDDTGTSIRYMVETLRRD